MKKIILVAMVFAWGVLATNNATYAAINIEDCEAWESYTDDRSEENLKAIDNEPIERLINQQANSKAWTGVDGKIIVGEYYDWEELLIKVPDEVKEAKEKLAEKNKSLAEAEVALDESMNINKDEALAEDDYYSAQYDVSVAQKALDEAYALPFIDILSADFQRRVNSNEVNKGAFKWSISDREYILAVRACGKAMVKDKDDPIKEILLREAELHLEKAVNELRREETVVRMPFVRHGGILPGSSVRGGAMDYVENKFIPKFVNGALVLLLSLSVLMLVVGGMMLLLSAGDSDDVARAKSIVIWSIAGVIITIMSYAIVQFIIGINFSL